MHSLVSCQIHCVWSTKNREPSRPGFTRTPLAISWRHRKTKSHEDARYWRSRRSHPHSALITGNIIGYQSNAASERKFIQMDSRNISEMRSFAWQEGYGTFSVGISGVDATVTYINN
jgi:hypothetical protein